MSNIYSIVEKWFSCWETGELDQLPITNDFEHTSPFGTISSKSTYLDIVEKNKDRFLGKSFQIIDKIIEGNNACVRYEVINPDGNMDVCEWYTMEGGLIKNIYSYYNIGDAKLVSG